MYTSYNLTVQGLTSAGFGAAAEENNVFTREEGKWNEVYIYLYPFNYFQSVTS